MDPFGIVGVEAERDRLHGRRGSGHGDERSGVLDRDGRADPVEDLVDGLAHRAQLLGPRWIVSDEPLREPNAPHLRRDRRDRTVGPHHELRRPAADVEDQVRGRCPGAFRPQALRRAEERQRRFALTGDHLEVRPRELADAAGEGVPVRGVADRRGRPHADRAGVEGSRAARVPLDDLERPIERLGRDRAGPVDVLSEPRDHHVAREVLEPVVPRFGDQQPRRVRPLVDRRQPPVALGVDRLHPLRDPRADDVVPARQVVRVVRVQTLHAGPGAADAAERPRRRMPACAFARVSLVGAGDRVGEVRLVLRSPVQSTDPPLGLERGHGADRIGTRQPEQRRERSAVRVEGGVARHERMSDPASSDHGERDDGVAAQLLGDDEAVAPAEFAHAGRYLRLCSIDRL